MCLWSQQVYDVTSYGAKGNGMTDDALAIQKAIDACSEQGGGRVLFPRNHTFLSGPVRLKSNVDLYLESTAVLLANPDESIYHLSAFGENRGEGMLWLWAQDAENITISGRGKHSGGRCFHQDWPAARPSTPNAGRHSTSASPVLTGKYDYGETRLCHRPVQNKHR